MPFINCETILQLKLSKDCFLVAGTEANQEPDFKTTDTNVCVPVVILSTQDNGKLLKQLESGFKKTLTWNKYQSKITNQAQNRYLNLSIDASYLRVNRFFYHLKTKMVQKVTSHIVF